MLVMAMRAPAPGNDVLAEYQQRRREFQPFWNRNWLVFFAGFVLFALGGETDLSSVAIAGFAICAAAGVRGVMLMRRHLRCPACETIQWPAVCFPYRQCRDCGQRLSQGWRDST